MEEYRNKVSNLHANLFQNISKFTSESYLEEHPEVKGGPWGGLPLRSLLAAVFGPPIGGATGIRDPPSRTPLGAIGTLLGVGPKGPWPPPCWGGRYTRERLAGVNIYLGIPQGISSQMAPI